MADTLIVENRTMSVTRTAVPLSFRPTLRVGWYAAAALSLSFASGSAWVLLGTLPDLRQVWIAVALGGGYLWLGLAAWDIARARGLALIVEPGRLVVIHDGMLGAPIEIPRDLIDAVAVDERLREDRRVAAAVRDGGIAPASFIDVSIPVIGAAPSSHAAYGSTVAPNVVVFLRAPVKAPPVPLAARALLHIATGRAGRYRGPKPGRALRALRLCVPDARAVAQALDGWGVIATLPRDARYLAPVTDANRRKAKRARVLLAALVVGAGLIIPGAMLFARLTT